MRDVDEVNAFLREADQHIGQAEELVRRLACDQAAPIRRMRAAMYVKAMKRLRHLVELHRTLPWNQPARHAGPVGARLSPRTRWLPLIRGWVSREESSVAGHDP